MAPKSAFPLLVAKIHCWTKWFKSSSILSPVLAETSKNSTPSSLASSFPFSSLITLSCKSHFWATKAIIALFSLFFIVSIQSFIAMNEDSLVTSYTKMTALLFLKLVAFIIEL